MQIEQKLAERLEKGLLAWTQEVRSYKEGGGDSADTDTVPGARPGGDPVIKVPGHVGMDCCLYDKKSISSC